MEKKTVYDRIGFSGLLDVVWTATPLWKIPAIPYGLYQYYDMLNHSYDTTDIYQRHHVKKKNSALYNFLRPNFSLAEKQLKKKYKISSNV